MAEDVRSRILRAFSSIVRERSPEKLTVKALIDRAGISRQTFYYYFEDIMDVLDFVFQGGLQSSLKRCATATSTAQAIRFYMEDQLEYESVWPRLVGGRERLEQLIYESTYTFIEQLLPQYTGYEQLTQKDAPFLMDFYAAILVHALLNRSDRKGLPLLAQQIDTALQGSLSAFGSKNKIPDKTPNV